MIVPPHRGNPMSAAANRADSFRQLLAHLRAAYEIDVGFILWDGSKVPADLPDDALALVIADEGTVAAMVRRPTFNTALELFVSGRVDLRNGTIIDLLSRRPKVRTKELRKRINRWLALRVLAKFIFVPGGGPWPLR